MQRILDILLSAAALLALCPLFVFIITLLRLTGEGEVFFTQVRIGKDGQPFRLYKFVTMLKNSPQMGTGTITVKDDPRILPIGRLLRATKINELPQLLNVLLGSMSIVGPRPQAIDNFSAYPQYLQKVICQTKPGLSGIGSIIFRAEEQILLTQTDSVEFYSYVIAPYKATVEAWYIANQSLHSYFAVLYVTIWVVFFPSSRLVWQVFRGLPPPPDALKGLLNYPTEATSPRF